MKTFLGVKNLLTAPLYKRDLLLFDKILIQELESHVKLAPQPSKAADLEYLVHHGFIESVNSESLLEPFTKSRHPLHIRRVLGFSLLVTAIIAKESPTILKDPEKTALFNQLADFGIQTGFDFQIRLLAERIEEVLHARTVPIINPPGHSRAWDIDKDTEALLKHFEEHAEDWTKGLETYKKSDHSIAIKALENLLGTFYNVMNKRDPIDSTVDLCSREVTQITLEALPVPDEDTPLEDILTFLSDPESRKRLADLRSWIRSISKAVDSPAEVREELDYLLAAYIDQLRYHKLRIRNAMLQAVIALPFEIAESIVKLKWSKIGRAITSIVQNRASLLESERNAPGREVSYILKARDEFQ